MANWLDYVVLFVYLAGIVAIAVRTRSHSKTVNDFLLAGKGIGGIMTAFAYGTTYFSAVVFVGYAGSLGPKFGLSSLWIGVFNALIGSLVAWILLAKRTRRMTHFYNAKTMSEMLQARYDSGHLKLICSLIIFVFLVPYAASVYTGLGYLFEMAFNIPFWAVVLIMASATALYLVFGGYFATAVTNFIQGLIMLVGVCVMLFALLDNPSVNWGEGFGNLIESGKGFFPEVVKDGAPFGYTLIMNVLLTSIGVWGLPQIVHKFYTVKSEKEIKPAVIVSTVFCFVIGVGAYLVGCFAPAILGSDMAGLAGEAIIPQVLNRILGAGLLGLIIVLVLSASMSTLSGVTLSSSSSVAVDIYSGYIRKDAGDKRTNRLMRILCVVFIAVSVIIAIINEYTSFTSIVSLMSFSWGTLAACFLAPYIYGLYSKKATKAAAYSCIFSGLGLTLILYIVSVSVPTLAPYLTAPAIGVICMAVNFALMPIVSAFTKKPDDKETETLFAALKKGNE